MRRYIDTRKDKLSEEEVKLQLEIMLSSAKPDIRKDSIKIEEYQTENLTDTSVSVDPGKLLGKGRVSYWYTHILDKEQKSTHSFKLRKVGNSEIQVTITDHANAL